ncbi:MAG: hypothetical protein JO246_10055 [Frankiaceae bacterium]|nr:hypothetical protein [Frankiaceae bacterium]
MSPEARAERLLRWYPAMWRDRYGAEFAELLIAEIEEQPTSWRRTADVARSGLVARLSLAGLGNGPVRDERSALGATATLVAGFAMLATSLWTQLATGARVMPLDSHAAVVGLVVLTASLAYLGVIAILAVAPVAAVLARDIRRRGPHGVIAPLTVIAVSLTALAMGGRHLATHWTVLASHGSGTSHIPDGIASFAWAETYSISTAWAHPTLLLSINPARLGWMVVSPLALISALTAAWVLVRRLDLPAATLRYEATLARAAVVGMLPMLLAGAWWVMTSQHNPAATYRAGTLDLALILVMTGAAAAALHSTRALRSA